MYIDLSALFHLSIGIYHLETWKSWLNLRSRGVGFSYDSSGWVARDSNSPAGFIIVQAVSF